MKNRDRRAEWALQYQAGMTIAEIAATAGIADSTLWWHLQVAGVQMRAGNPSLAAHADEWARLYAAGRSLKQIAAAFDCHLTCVRHHLVQRGVQMRPPGRPARPAA